LGRGTLTESNENFDPKVYSLCEEAVKKIDDLDQKERDDHKNLRLGTTSNKKEIVAELAERLEQLIPQPDTISTTILKLLKKRVSKSLIHSCLPAKYKQEHRIKNALKQKKKKNIKEEPKLAPLVALKPQKEEAEKKKTKVEVMAGTDGRSYIQREGDGKTSENEPKDYTDSSFKDNTSNQASTTSQQTEQERQSIDNEDRFDSELEYQKLNNINDQNFEQEDILEDPNSLTDTSNKSKIAEETSVEQFFENNKDILHFEVSRTFKFVQNLLNELFPKTSYYGQVCFKGSIDKKNGKVINFEIEGHNQKQHRKQPTDENIGHD
jgi:hypothetical protein